MGDILTIAQKKQYLVLDPVQADPPDPKLPAVLMYKKKVHTRFGLKYIILANFKPIIYVINWFFCRHSVQRPQF